MEEDKVLEIDLRNYIQSYLEDEYLADMEYKGGKLSQLKLRILLSKRETTMSIA